MFTFSIINFVPLVESSVSIGLQTLCRFISFIIIIWYLGQESGDSATPSSVSSTPSVLEAKVDLGLQVAFPNKPSPSYHRR